MKNTPIPPMKMRKWPGPRSDHHRGAARNGGPMVTNGHRRRPVPVADE